MEDISNTVDNISPQSQIPKKNLLQSLIATVPVPLVVLSIIISANWKNKAKIAVK